MSTANAPVLEHTFASELEGLYTAHEPPGFKAPSLLLLNRELATELGLDPEWLQEHGAAALSGSELLPGTRPLAQVYAGHQFGHFNPQLGDGRAVLLGEVVDPQGRRFDIQLKGAGTTPYSRNGDGRAALDSALREYIVSEAMHALGIPTTRSLAVVTTGERVVRERVAPGGVLTRVAASHIRVGTLEFFASRKQKSELRRLVDYTLRRHYPDEADAPNQAKALLNAVGTSQAELVAQWMLIGFVHGVMNTDNVTLSGETIDYGPCAFMEQYNPRTVFSQIDHRGRYAFGNQPGIGAWNLARMAEALLNLLAVDEDQAVAMAQESLKHFGETVEGRWLDGMRKKLGLVGVDGGDQPLVQDLLDWMTRTETDYTSAFRRLSRSLVNGGVAFEGEEFAAWNERWHSRLGDADPQQTAAAMDRVNPIYIVRNHKIEAALDAAIEGDMGPTNELMEVLSRPFEEQPGRESYAEPAPPDFGPYSTHCNT
ncbi:MAG: YdiU family protein [Myxococcota bacterium]